MGKDLESLQESREIRQHLINKWGMLPSSIFKVDWSKSTNIELTERTYQEQKEQSQWADTPFSLSSIGARHGGLSRFPQDLGRFLVRFYTEEKDVILDPCAGHNSRMELCWRLNRYYVGLDISHNFMKLNLKIQDMLYEENNGSMLPIEAKIKLIEADSRDLLDYVPENSMDFCMTSPPFWFLEDYGSEPGQLGHAKDYGDFIYSLGVIVKNCFKALKPGAFIAWEVNDFRVEGKWYPYHADGIRLFRDAGFALHDILIVDYGSSFLSSFLSDVKHHRALPKQHAYIIIGRKPKVGRKEKRDKTRERLLAEVAEAEPVDEKRQGALL